MIRLFEIRDGPLSVDEVLAAVRRPEAGGVAIFCGTVRNHHEGGAVTRLEYESYSSMAARQLREVARQIEADVSEVMLAAVHRVGSLEVGELAVVCAASAPHRAEAFEACRRYIDTIKLQVPIWKREIGPDGSHWVGWGAG